MEYKVNHLNAYMKTGKAGNRQKIILKIHVFKSGKITIFVS